MTQKARIFFGIVLIVCGVLHIISRTHTIQTYQHHAQTPHQRQPLYVSQYDLLHTFVQDRLAHGQSPYIFPHQTLLADIMRIGGLQYVGKFVQRHEAPYFLDKIQNITNLAPGWVYPFVFTQLLGPYQKDSPDLDQDKKHQSRLTTVDIGQQGAKRFCNSKGCEEYQLPQFLGFNYYYYLQQREQASHRYAVAAQNPDAPEGLKNMPAIIKGRLGAHRTSAQMRYQKYQTLQDSLDTHYNTSLAQKSQRYLHKAIYEYSLSLIEDAESMAINSGECLHDYECLVQKKYLHTTILDAITQCTNQNEHDTVSNTFCVVLEYGLQKGFISMEGQLTYPFNTPKEQFRYARDKNTEQRWIQQKNTAPQP